MTVTNSGTIESSDDAIDVYASGGSGGYGGWADSTGTGVVQGGTGGAGGAIMQQHPKVQGLEATCRKIEPGAGGAVAEMQLAIRPGD